MRGQPSNAAVSRDASFSFSGFCVQHHVVQHQPSVGELPCFLCANPLQGVHCLVLAASLSPDGNILSVGDTSVPARDGSILSVCGKRFRCAEVLLQPGFTGTRVSGFYDTSLQSSTKCDVYIRKELYAISRCQVARSCSAAVPNTSRPVPNTSRMSTSCRQSSIRNVKNSPPRALLETQVDGPCQ